MGSTSSKWMMAAVLFFLSASLGQARFTPGKNAYLLRGRQQDLYFTPGIGPRVENRPVVLFLPGDRGWAGKAIAMSREIASWGYDVYSLDTNRYLMSFTGNATLTEAAIVGDLATVAREVAPRRRVMLVGWSEGAGLAALAAASPGGKNLYAGLIVFGLSDKNALARRWKDYLSILTESEPNEPTFSVKPRLAEVAPLPIAILRATGDQFVSEQEARELAAAAAEPKRYVEVDARNHRFDGNEAGFYRELKESLEWAEHSGS